MTVLEVCTNALLSAELPRWVVPFVCCAISCAMGYVYGRRSMK